MENFKKSFEFNFKFAIFCGFLGNPRKSKTKQFLSLFLVATIVVFPCTCALLKFLLHQNLITFVNVAAVLVGLSCLGLKIGGLMIKGQEFRSCLQQFNELEEFDENEILKKLDQKVPRFVIGFMVFEFLAALTYIVVSISLISDEDFILPFPVKIESTYWSFIINTFQAYIGLTSSIVSSLVESIIGTLFITFSSHLDCLCLKLKRVAMAQRGEMKTCIKYHGKLLELFKSIENCFKEVIFVQSYAMTVVMCTLAFQLSLIKPLDEPELAFKIFFVMCAFFSQIYLPYYLGTLVADKSSKIVEAAYFSKWYQADIRVRKDLVIIMTMAQKEMEMDIMGFFPLNLEQFVEASFHI